MNELELAILSALCENHPSLRELLSQLHVLSREFTGVGSYTHFQCNGSSPDLDSARIDLRVTIEMPTVPHGLGALLFCEAGKPKILEIYTYGNELWDGVCDGFSLATST